MIPREVRQARERVRDQVQDHKLGFMLINEADGVENLGDDQLKEFEYALLVGVVNRGLASYLDGAKLSPIRDRRMPGELADRIGSGVAERVAEEYKSGTFRQTIDVLAAERAKRLRAIHPALSKNIYPLEAVINAAALSGTGATYASVVAVASVIKASGDFDDKPRADFIDAIKRSADFPLTRTMASLRWHAIINDELYEMFEAAMGGGVAANTGALVYDADKKTARLAVPIEDWRLSERPGAVMSELAPEDERIGCPVSFDLKQTRRFYEHVVDMAEHHQSWPGDLADPNAHLLPMEMIHALGMGVRPQEAG